MKITLCEAVNFGSYGSLYLNTENLGLSLISGATGAGKSTIMDAVCWTLYGQTAKDGNVDDVKSWVYSDYSTWSQVLVETPTGTIHVNRTRGKANQNDLYWLEGDDYKKHRGKDLTETQKLLNLRLGADFDQYTMGSYFHEFSPTASFFTANAKSRRSIFEKVATLDLPMKIAEKTSEAKKIATSWLRDLELALNSDLAVLATLQAQYKTIKRDMTLWEEAKEHNLTQLDKKLKDFDTNKAAKVSQIYTNYCDWEAGNNRAIKELQCYMSEKENGMPAETSCDVCGGPFQSKQKSYEQHQRHLNVTKDKLKNLLLNANPYQYQLDHATSEVNTYADRLEEETNKVNPFDHSYSQIQLDISEKTESLAATEAEKQKFQHSLQSLGTLNELSYDLRAALLTQAVQEIQDATNTYLESYFDSEIKVTFELEGADSLKVGIQKSGYECVYRQLSKGQRGLLKLCFSVAMMKASSNSAGVHFSTLFFDEALDGLDISMKLKAFRLFAELSTQHDTILVIDHCEELKTLFQNRYEVTLESDGSILEQV